jgi:glycosyltransferase involved in cell wall biosynthesis
LRVLQIIDTLHTGGAERMAVNIANALSNRDIKHTLIVTRELGKLSSQVREGTSLLVLNKRHTFDLIALFRIVRLLLVERPSIVHAHSTSIYWTVFIKLLFPGLILVWHDHFGNRTVMGLKFMALIDLMCDEIIVVNKSLYNWYKLRMRSSNIHFINNFINESIHIDSTIVKQNTIILCGSILKLKSHHTCIDALSILKARGYELSVSFVGSIPDKEWHNKLLIQIDQLGLTNNITFTGAVTNVHELMAKHVIGILCSEYEGLPMSLLEYGLASLPVVVTNVGQCAEVVDHGQAGLLVEPGNPQQLADAIEYLLTNQSFARELGQKLHQRVMKHYGEGAFMEQYLQLITKYI